jgi:hypothetical protein
MEALYDFMAEEEDEMAMTAGDQSMKALLRLY